MAGLKLSVVIPCYGSEQTIRDVVANLKATILAREGYTYEIILVNDSSPDNVMDVLNQLAEDDGNIKVVELAKNFGQHNAIMAGFQYFTGDVVVCMDDDGQTPAEEIFNLIAPLQNGYDVVFAKYPDKKHSLVRNLGSRVNDWMANFLLGKPKDLSLMSYFAAKAFIIEEVRRYRNPFPYIGGLLLRCSNKITNVEIPHRERLAGQSGYSLKKLFSLWMNGFTAFSVKPLRFASFTGFFSAAAGGVFLIYILINKLFINPDVPLGYSSTMATLLFIGGIMMLSIGLIGEYIGRIYISINQSPQYTIRNTVNIKEHSNEAEH